MPPPSHPPCRMRHIGHRRRTRRFDRRDPAGGDGPPRGACWKRPAIPRFHIGESLLPANLPLLERLGVADEVRCHRHGEVGRGIHIAIGMGGTRNSCSPNAWDKSMPLAYQVRRSEFDEILIRRAVARAPRSSRVPGSRRGISRSADASRVRCRGTRTGARSPGRPRQLIDASGRDTFLGNRLRHQAAQQEAQQLGHVRPFHGSAARRGQARRETSRSTGSTTGGFGSSRWPTARPASAPSYGRTT